METLAPSYNIRRFFKQEELAGILRKVSNMATVTDQSSYWEKAQREGFDLSWLKQLEENTKSNGAADRQHTLNTLDLTKEDGLSRNSTGD